MNGIEETILGDVEASLENADFERRKVDYARRSGRFILIKRGRPEIWVYMGTSGDYVIVDRVYCSCPGFASRITRERVGGCTHVAALREGPEIYHDIDVDDDTVVRIVMECMILGRSVVLRREIG